MKRLSIGILAIASLFCSQRSSGYYCHKNAKIKAPIIDSIVIFKAEYGIETPAAVCCEEIFRNFIVEKQVILNKDSMSTIVSELKNVSKMKDWDTCVDTRAVINIFSKGSIIKTVCIGHLSIIRINNEIVELKDRRLINYVFNLKN